MRMKVSCDNLMQRNATQIQMKIAIMKNIMIIMNIWSKLDYIALFKEPNKFLSKLIPCRRRSKDKQASDTEKEGNVINTD